MRELHPYGLSFLPEKTRKSGHYIKCRYGQKVSLDFGISITSKNVFNPIKVNSDIFCHKIKLLICRFVHAQWSWPRIKDWWRMTSLQEYLKAFCFYFAYLTTASLRQLQFVCFLSRKTPHHYWNNSYLNYSAWTRRISWFLTWRHDPFRNPDPFLHWLPVNFIWRGWNGKFKARS